MCIFQRFFPFFNVDPYIYTGTDATVERKVKTSGGKGGYFQQEFWVYDTISQSCNGPKKNFILALIVISS